MAKGFTHWRPGARNAYITYWPMRIAAGCGVLLALLLTLQPQVWWWALLPLILAVPFALSGWLAWRSAGWYAGNGEWLLLQRGAFTLTSTAARIDQIQYVSWSQGSVLARQRDLLTGHLGCHERRGGSAQPAPRLPPPAGRSLARSHPRRGRDGRRENRDLERIRAIAAPGTDLGVIAQRPPAYLARVPRHAEP